LGADKENWQENGVPILLSGLLFLKQAEVVGNLVGQFLT
jgi:hypothetical protein